MRKILLSLAAGALLIGIVTAVASAAVGRGGDITARNTSARGSAATTSSPLADTFSILRGPRTAGDAVAAALHPESLPEAAVSSHRLKVPTAVGRAWLTADTDVMCLSIEGASAGAGTACNKTVDSDLGFEMTLGPLPDGSIAVVGVVPDGVDAVDVTLANGSAQRLPVSENAYAATVKGATKSVDFVVGGKQVNRPLLSYRG